MSAYRINTPNLVEDSIPKTINLMNTIPQLGSYHTVFPNYSLGVIEFSYISSNYSTREIRNNVIAMSGGYIKMLGCEVRGLDLSIKLSYDECLNFENMSRSATPVSNNSKVEYTGVTMSPTIIVMIITTIICLVLSIQFGIGFNMKNDMGD